MTEEQADNLLKLMAAQVLIAAETRDLVKAALHALASEPSTDDVFIAGCQHPDESRVDLSTPGDVNHWICRECKFDNKAVA